MQTTGQDILKGGPAAAILRGIANVLPASDQDAASLGTGGAATGFVDVLDEMTAAQPHTEAPQGDKDFAVLPYVIPLAALQHELPQAELAVADVSTAALDLPQDGPGPVGPGEEQPLTDGAAQEAGQPAPQCAPALLAALNLRSGEVMSQPSPAFLLPPLQPSTPEGEVIQPAAPRKMAGPSAGPQGGDAAARSAVSSVEQPLTEPVLKEPNLNRPIPNGPPPQADGLPGPIVATPAAPSAGPPPLPAVDLVVPAKEIAAPAKTNPAPQQADSLAREGLQVAGAQKAAYFAQPMGRTDGQTGFETLIRPPTSLAPRGNSTHLATASPAMSVQEVAADEAWKPVSLRSTLGSAPYPASGGETASQTVDPNPGLTELRVKITQHQLPEQPSGNATAMPKAQASQPAEGRSLTVSQPAPPPPPVASPPIATPPVATAPVATAPVSSPPGEVQGLVDLTSDVAQLLSAARVLSGTRAAAPEAGNPQDRSRRPAADLPGPGLSGRLQAMQNAAPLSVQKPASPEAIFAPETDRTIEPTGSPQGAMADDTAPPVPAPSTVSAPLAGPGTAFAATIPAAWQMISGGMTVPEPVRFDPQSDTPAASLDNPAAAPDPALSVPDQPSSAPTSPERIATDQTGQNLAAPTPAAPDLMAPAATTDALPIPAGPSDRMSPGLSAELSQLERLAAEPLQLGPHPHPVRQLAEAVLAAPADQPGTLELTLTPESLGKLRFDMRMEGDSLAVTLSAENPQTLDLMRRHLPDLMAELKQLGLQAGTMSFGTWGEGRQPSSQTSPQTTAFPPDPIPEPASLAERPAATPRKGVASGQLDIRL